MGNDKYDFLKEHIKKRPVNKAKLAKYIGLAILIGAVFGVVAALVFAVVTQLLKGKEDNTPVETIVLSVDEVEVEQETEDDSVPEEPIVITETVSLELADYQALQNKLYAVGKNANKSVVAVETVKSGTDWFDNEYQTQGIGSGIVVAETHSDYLILTEKKLLEGVENISVKFNGDLSAEGQLIAYDANTGMAVLEVSKADLGDTAESFISVCQLGTSAALYPGSMVIAIGSPLGDPFTIITGDVIDVSKNVSVYDASYETINTDISCVTDASGALINTEGKVIGLVVQDFDSNKEHVTLTALAITDIKPMIEKLVNGNRPAYLGIKLHTVPAKIAEENRIPDGVYVKEVADNSPAMRAGIQVSDVITSLNGYEITTETSFESALLACDDGQEIDLVVMRQGGDGKYTAINMKATLDILN